MHACVPLHIGAPPLLSQICSHTVPLQTLPAVQLAGTPTVNVANFPTGGGATTALAFHQLVTISAGSFQALSNVDVSAYSDVRVVATATGFADFQVFVFVVDENGGPDLLIDGDIIRGKGQGTGLYTIPGRQIRILLGGSISGSSNVSVSVFGRG